MTVETAERAPSSFRKPEPMAPPKEEPVASEAGGTLCNICTYDREDNEWSYCPSCGWPVNLDEIIELTDEDLETYLFSGYTKKEFELFSGRVKFEIRTLQSKDNNDVASEMSAYSLNKNLLNADFQAEQRMKIMSKALVSWMGVALDEEKAREALEGLAEGILALIQDRYNAMCRGVELELSKERRIKKS